MSEEKYRNKYLTDRERITLDRFEAHMVKKIRETIDKIDLEYSFDPRDDEMMSEIYPES